MVAPKCVSREVSRPFPSCARSSASRTEWLSHHFTRLARMPTHLHWNHSQPMAHNFNSKWYRSDHPYILATVRYSLSHGCMLDPSSGINHRLCVESLAYRLLLSKQQNHPLVCSSIPCPDGYRMLWAVESPCIEDKFLSRDWITLCH